MVYNVLLPIDWCTITLDNVLDPDNGADSDSDTLTDWSEANVELLHWQTDGSIILPTIKEHLDTEALNRFVLEYGGSIPSSDMNIIIGTHILPAVSHPKNPYGDGDGFSDSQDLAPLTPFVNPVMLIHGRIDNTYTAFGLSTPVCPVDETGNVNPQNNHFGTIKTKSGLHYNEVETHKIYVEKTKDKPQTNPE